MRPKLYGFCLWVPLFSLACQKLEFNTDFPPPQVEVTVGEVYPHYIGNIERQLSRLSLPEGLYGTQATYGSLAQIQVIQTANPEVLEKYRQLQLQPLLDKFSQKIIREDKGRFQVEAKAEDGSRLVAWSNPPWLFIIQTVSEVYLAEIVEKFAFIKPAQKFKDFARF